MARRQKMEVTCDRCTKIFEAPEPSDDGAHDHTTTLPSRGLFIDATELGLDQVAYEDLCPRCRKRCTDLICLIKKVKEAEEAGAQAAADDGEQSTHRPASRDGSTPETEERQ